MIASACRWPAGQMATTAGGRRAGATVRYDSSRAKPGKKTRREEGGELWCDVMDQRLHRPQTASPRLPRLLRPSRRPRPARPATPWLERLLWLLARPAPPRYSPLLPGEFPRRPAQPAYNYRPARVWSLEKPNPSESRGLAHPDLAADCRRSAVRDVSIAPQLWHLVTITHCPPPLLGGQLLHLQPTLRPINPTCRLQLSVNQQ